MSVPTLCRIATTLSVYPLTIFCSENRRKDKLGMLKALSPMVESVTPVSSYLESVMKTVIPLMNHKDENNFHLHTACKKISVSADSNSVKFQISQNESILSSSVRFTRTKLFIFVVFRYSSRSMNSSIALR